MSAPASAVPLTIVPAPSSAVPLSVVPVSSVPASAVPLRLSASYAAPRLSASYNGFVLGVPPQTTVSAYPRMSRAASRLNATEQVKRDNEVAQKTPGSSGVNPQGIEAVIRLTANGTDPVLTSFGLRWMVCGLLGKGVFGNIYTVYDRNNQNLLAACKVEPHDCPRKLLLEEKQMMDYLAATNVVPKVIEFGNTPTHEYLVMELVGKSLAELRSGLNGQFSLSTGLRLAALTLKGIAAVQAAGICHGDVKPGNFAIGVNDKARAVYILDFGLSRPFPEGEHKANFRGTVKYASLHAHEHKNLTARDDLWSWFYMVIEWLKGSLPWTYLCMTPKQPRNAVEKLKREWNSPFLTQDLPPQLYQIMQYLASLHFFDLPDFYFLESLIEGALEYVGATWDDLYDWETPAGQQALAFQAAKFGIHPYVPTGALGRTEVDGKGHNAIPNGLYQEDRHLLPFGGQVPPMMPPQQQQRRPGVFDAPVMYTPEFYIYDPSAPRPRGPSRGRAPSRRDDAPRREPSRRESSRRGEAPAPAPAREPSRRSRA